MTTITIDSLPIEKPLVVGGNSAGYVRNKLIYPNVATISGKSITAVAVGTAGSYAMIPAISATVGAGATFSPAMGLLTAAVATPQSGSGSYAPADTITLADSGGTETAKAVLTVTHTQVISATIAAAGTGGTPGTATVTGTTGTGTKFQASVTISGGGAITAVNSIAVAGDYTVNPTSLTAEPVTGGGLTGAQLNVKMGVLNFTVSTAGSYTVLPSNPVAQFSTTGAGTGFTATLNTWKFVSVAVLTGGDDYDNTTVINIAGGGSTGGGALTPTVSGVDSPVVTSVVFSKPFPSTSYEVNGNANQACVVSYANKTIYGFDIVMTPLSGGTITSGSVDVSIEYTA